MTNAPRKKRHHFVPVAYLSNFVGTDGKLCVYNNDERTKFKARPEAIGFERYYYAQPLPNGGRDTNTIEDAFGTEETVWKRVAERLESWRTAAEDLEAIFRFIVLQRVRVPAARDLLETGLANKVMEEFTHLDRLGLLPPKPPELLAHPNAEIVPVIDPHTSIHGMLHHTRRLEGLFGRMQLHAVHNETGVPFLTSDNPVSYFDPTVPEKQMQPYSVRPTGPFELLFPVTNRTLIQGTPTPKKLKKETIRHVRLRDAARVHRFNRISARFAYRMVFASDWSHRELVERYAELSPVLNTPGPLPDDPATLIASSRFGKRPKKPRWTS